MIENNQAFHRMLTDGVDVSWMADGLPDGQAGGERHDKVWLLNVDNSDDNDWLAVNQFTVVERRGGSQTAHERRPDVVLFINGLPLAVVELKNPTDEKATIRHAFNQLQPKRLLFRRFARQKHRCSKGA